MNVYVIISDSIAILVFNAHNDRTRNAYGDRIGDTTDYQNIERTSNNLDPALGTGNAAMRFIRCGE